MNKEEINKLGGNHVAVTRRGGGQGDKSFRGSGVPPTTRQVWPGDVDNMQQMVQMQQGVNSSSYSNNYNSSYNNSYNPNFNFNRNNDSVNSVQVIQQLS
jgi:hypothetical protein